MNHQPVQPVAPTTGDNKTIQTIINHCSYKFQNTDENQRDQSYRLYIQQAVLQKGEITAHLKHFRLHLAKTTMTRCNSCNITSILQNRVTSTH